MFGRSVNLFQPGLGRADFFIFRLTDERVLFHRAIQLKKLFVCTGKFLSEALIFPSTNPQYDDRLFIELQLQLHENSKLRIWGEHVVYRNCFYIQNSFCTQHVLQKEELPTKINH